MSKRITLTFTPTQVSDLIQAMKVERGVMPKFDYPGAVSRLTKLFAKLNDALVEAGEFPCFEVEKYTELEIWDDPIPTRVNEHSRTNSIAEQVLSLPSR